MITPTEIRRRLKEIRRCTWDDGSAYDDGSAMYDDEKAHTLEDQLYMDVLKTIATGSGYSQRLARLALNARRIRFERWAA